VKHILLFAASFFLFIVADAQRSVPLQNLWAKPQVHVRFEGYTLSFKIKDIDRALILLAETGDSSYGIRSRLDTNGNYQIDLYPGLSAEYRNKIQPLMQRGVGAFLLLAGHAEVRNARNKKLSEVIADIQDKEGDEHDLAIKFYDPKNNHLLFFGSMSAELYNKDLGIE